MSANRLTHSHSAYLRYMQMSQSSIFAFVEGKDLDPFFYGQICSSVCGPKGIRYQLCKANELSPDAGGKTTLIEFHNYLQQKRAIVSVFKEKKTTVVFFLDKDIDDLSRSLRRSIHIIYTRYYDVHNEVYCYGNLVRGAACTASLDEAVLSPLLSDSTKWCAQAARRWQDWLVLCLISALKKCPSQSNFRVTSKIQCCKTGVSDPTKLNKNKLIIAKKLQLSPIDFQRIYDKHYALVKKHFQSGQHDIIFKGKWYPILLDEDICQLVGKTGYQKNGFTKRITSSVATTLDFADTWTDYYTSRLQTAIGEN